MNTINKTREIYINKMNDIDIIRNRIEERKNQIERLNNKLNKLYDKSFWGDLLIRPIMEQVKEKYPEIIWDDDQLTPMGLCSRISLFGKIKEQTIILCFTPRDLSNGIICYDTEERTNEYSSNSIGGWNDMDKVSEDIINIEQIYTHIKKQIKDSTNTE